MEKDDKNIGLGVRQGQRPNCWNCHYFAISWHPSMPYACRLMGFKSRILPCREVEAVDSRFCQGFLEKTIVKNKESDFDKSKSDMWIA